MRGDEINALVDDILPVLGDAVLGRGRVQVTGTMSGRHVTVQPGFPEILRGLNMTQALDLVWGLIGWNEPVSFDIPNCRETEIHLQYSGRGISAWVRIGAESWGIEAGQTEAGISARLYLGQHQAGVAYQQKQEGVTIALTVDDQSYVLDASVRRDQMNFTLQMPGDIWQLQLLRTADNEMTARLVAMGHELNLVMQRSSNLNSITANLDGQAYMLTIGSNDGNTVRVSLATPQENYRLEVGYDRSNNIVGSMTMGMRSIPFVIERLPNGFRLNYSFNGRYNVVSFTASKNDISFVAEAGEYRIDASAHREGIVRGYHEIYVADKA